jgi:(p)ppGpp synthase/HD superfamily hydrolase
VELGERFTRALARAAEIHGEQKRKGTEDDPEIPYIAHLLAVCALVLQDGGDETEAIAALLHDAAEDQGGEAMLHTIKGEFGADVAKIVAECSDTFERPKPPWRARKERYLAHLPEASPSALRVSVADKLDNARAILFDYRRLGDDLWARFDPEADQLWYYRSLVTTYRGIAGFESTLVDELDRTVAEIEMLVGADHKS